MTAEELAGRPDLDPCELVHGKIVPLSPASPSHGMLELRLGAALLAWSERAEAGARAVVMSGEVGLLVRRNPDTVRGADLALISRGRFARRGPFAFLDIAPELVVEILSPGERRRQIEDKLEDYFSMGVDLVWTVDPERRTILAYRSLTDIERFTDGQTLAGPEILPGFGLPVSHLFRA
jgi:Uma2 family endonuclease